MTSKPDRTGFEPASPGQNMTFILTERKFCHHGTLESAQAERQRLQAKYPHKKFRLMKVLNLKSADLEKYDVQIVITPKSGKKSAA